MALGVYGDADAAHPVLTRQVHEVQRVAQLPLGEDLGGGQRRVAVQREQVLDPDASVSLDQGDQLGAAVGCAGQVRQR